MSIEQLNKDYAIDGQLDIIEGKGGLQYIKITSAKATSLISIYGAQVLSYQPKGSEDDLLFVSPAAYYQSGKAIKGGIPLCWPWFGEDPAQQGRPAHGFVRTQMWRLLQTEILAGGDIRIVFGSPELNETNTLWPYRSELTLEVLIGDSLSLALVSRNTGDVTFPLSQALHTYLRVGDIDQVKVLGLDDTDYLDKPDAFKQKQQRGAVTVNGEVDRIYLNVSPELIVEDNKLQRRIRIVSKGNNTAVVWNPWLTISRKMGDLLDDDYLRFICVETTNAASDVIQMEPGSEYRLEADYRLEGI